MPRFKLMFTVLLIIFTCSGFAITRSRAGEPSFSRKIVVFQDGVSRKEIRHYASEWKRFGVLTVMELPLINGLVLRVPPEVSSADLAVDPRVMTVEDDQPVKIQAVNAAGDGGAGDGGAGDGGAGDGGAGDGGAGDGGAGDGGAGDGGAGDGGAGDGGAGDGGAGDGGAGGNYDSPPSWSFVKPTSEPPNHHRPWGVLKLYDQLRDPQVLTDEFHPNRVSTVIRLASRQMTRRSVRVAILDTGVDFTHPSLAEKLKAGFDITTMTPGLPPDDNGHGTHIAGTVCANLDDDPFGLAPAVELYPVKILDKYAMGSLANIIMGLSWAIDNDIDVVNMSIAYREDSQAVRLAIQKAYQAGITMVAAAGNHSNWDAPSPVAAGDGGAGDGGAGDGGAGDGGAGDGGAGDGGAGDGGAGDGGAGDGGAADGQQGELPWYSVMYPARYPEVIAVGASNSFGDMTEFTNSGEELDLTAPGINIVSTNVWRWGGFGVCSGTSMATPHVTGAVALMLALDPQLSPQEVASILKYTAAQGDLNLVGALKKTWTVAFWRAWRARQHNHNWFSKF